MITDGEGMYSLLFSQHIPHGTAHGLLVHLIPQQVPVGQQLIQGPLDLPHVGGDVLGDVAVDLVGELYPQHGGLVFDDGQSRLEVGRGHIHHKARHEAALQPVLQLGHFTGRTVGGQHDLPPGFVQGVEGVKELLLGLLLAGDELDIVHQQDARLPVLLPELGVAALPDGCRSARW